MIFLKKYLFCFTYININFEQTLLRNQAINQSDCPACPLRYIIVVCGDDLRAAHRTLMPRFRAQNQAVAQAIPVEPVYPKTILITKTILKQGSKSRS